MKMTWDNKIALLTCLFIVSMSFSVFADAHDDALAEMELQDRYQAGTHYLYPETGYNNSTAYNTSGNVLNFSGNGTLGGNSNTYDNFDISVEGDLSIDSGASVASLTVNQTLGNTSEIRNLLSYVYALTYSFTHKYQSDSSNYTIIQAPHGQVTVDLIQYGEWPVLYVVYNNDGSYYIDSSAVSGGPYYGTYPAMFHFAFQLLQSQIEELGRLTLYNLNALFNFLTNGLNQLVDTQTYNYWYVSPSSSANGETFEKTVTAQSGTFHSILLNRLEYMADVLTFSFDRFFEWYYPLDIVNPEYWRSYDSDTQSQVSTNLAGVLYDISWYLGNLYILQSASVALDNMGQAVENVTTTFESVEAQENAVISSIESHIQSFNPSVSDFGAFRAIPWMSNYLQQIYVSLGTYGTVITVGLFLGVCLQIIGYLRYK